MTKEQEFAMREAIEIAVKNAQENAEPTYDVAIQAAKDHGFDTSVLANILAVERIRYETICSMN